MGRKWPLSIQLLELTIPSPAQASFRRPCVHLELLKSINFAYHGKKLWFYQRNGSWLSLSPVSWSSLRWVSVWRQQAVCGRMRVWRRRQRLRQRWVLRLQRWVDRSCQANAVSSFPYDLSFSSIIVWLEHKKCSVHHICSVVRRRVSRQTLTVSNKWYFTIFVGMLNSSQSHWPTKNDTSCGFQRCRRKNSFEWSVETWKNTRAKTLQTHSCSPCFFKLVEKLWEDFPTSCAPSSHTSFRKVHERSFVYQCESFLVDVHGFSVWVKHNS